MFLKGHLLFFPVNTCFALRYTNGLLLALMNSETGFCVRCVQSKL